MLLRKTPHAVLREWLFFRVGRGGVKEETPGGAPKRTILNEPFPSHPLLVSESAMVFYFPPNFFVEASHHH